MVDIWLKKFLRKVERAALLILNAYNKMSEESNDSKIEWFTTEKQKFKNLENS